MKLLLGLLLSFFTVPCYAQYVRVDVQSHREMLSSSLMNKAGRATCTISLPEKGSNASFGGTGTYIGKKQVITAWHVLRNGDLGKIQVTLNGVSYTASNVIKNKYADQAVMELSSEPEVEPVLIASTPPTHGDLVYGFGRYTRWQGRLSSYGDAGHGPQQETAAYQGTAGINGDSGGGMYNESGEYVGTFWGSGPGEAVSVRYKETVDFLERALSWQTSPCDPVGSPSSTPYAPSPSPRPPISAITKIGPVGPQGPIGETGPQGPQGFSGASVSTEQIAAIVLNITQQLKSDPALQGEQGLPGDTGGTGLTGPIGPEGPTYVPTPALIAQIKQEVIDELGPLIIQPAYDDNGILRPAGSPIALTYGGANLIPPAGLEVTSVNGLKTKTSGPLGGYMRTKMGKL